MGFACALDALSTITQQVFLSLGVEAIRGVARLRLANLGTVLADGVAAKAAAVRRNNSKARFREQDEAYFARHCYSDI